MRIPAKVDYAMRALLALAQEGGSATVEELAAAQKLSPKFLATILSELRRGGLVVSQRGASGGYRLARPPDVITVADVIRVIDGPLAEVRGLRPEHTHYDAPAEHLQSVWIALRMSLRQVLEGVTLDQVLRGALPRPVARLTENADAWEPRPLR